MSLQIRRLGPVDASVLTEAGDLFDGPLDAAAARRFLEAASHHLLLAYVEGVPAGFVSGVELTHPDKGTEMLLYELGVAEPYRRRGIGTSLTVALRDLARERGCYAMWVLTDRDNVAALAMYRAAGTPARETAEMLTWEVETPRSGPPENS